MSRSWTKGMHTVEEGGDAVAPLIIGSIPLATFIVR